MWRTHSLAWASALLPTVLFATNGVEKSLDAACKSAGATNAVE
jgi:hypothetical protein